MVTNMITVAMKMMSTEEIMIPAIAKPFPRKAPFDFLIWVRATIPRTTDAIWVSIMNGTIEHTKLTIASGLVLAAERAFGFAW